MSRPALRAAAAALAILAGMPPSASAIDAVCRVPYEYVKARVVFTQVAQARKAGIPVRIVVLGTGSSAGSGVSSPKASYPARLELWLARDWGPGAATVINVSQPGQTAAQMAARMAAVIRAERPHLIVWQTGTVDAIKGVDVNDFGDALERGMQIADEAKVNLLLVDSQFGSQAFVLRDVSPYLDYLDQIVRGRDVALFHRYAVMRYWAGSGAMDFTDASKARQQRVADQVHDCLGQLLATMIANASEWNATSSASPLQ